MITIEQVDEIIAGKKTEIAKFIDNSNIVAISSQGQYDDAMEIATAIRAHKKELEKERLELTGPLNKVVTAINKKVKAITGPLDNFEKSLKSICGTYLKEQEDKRAEEQKKRDEAARIERERIEAEARAQREKEDAARREEEETRRKAAQEQDAEKKKKLEEEAEKQRIIKEAAQAKADIKEQIAETTVSQEVAPTVDKGGLYLVDKFFTEIEDREVFIKWVLTSRMYEYLTINTALLDKEAQSSKGERTWPGIKTTKRQDSRMRAKKSVVSNAGKANTVDQPF